MQNSIRHDAKPPFKQVVIVQQTQNSNITSQTAADRTTLSKENYIANGQLEVSFKTADTQNEKQGNYDFKNLVINNYVQEYTTNQDMYENQESNKNEYAQPTLKINSFGYEKQKYYLSTFTDNGMRPPLHKDSQQTFGPPSLNHETALKYNREPKSENTKDKNDLHQMTINNERTYSGDQSNTQTDNQK